MVLIITSFGATQNYPDQEMMRKTFGAFLNSLDRQMDKKIRLFISYHDKPKGMKLAYPFIQWCGMAPKPDDMNNTLTPWPLPLPKGQRLEEIRYEIQSHGCKIDDMSRKTWNSAIEAFKWARSQNLKRFWMLRMDSDDLLANNFIQTLHNLWWLKVEAVYNRTCHIFDPRRKELGVYHYPYSTTCNTLLFQVNGDSVNPDWDFLLTDHTRFMHDVRRAGITFREIDHTLCILTNTGNSISGRPTIAEHEHTMPAKMSREIVERYGLETLL